VCSVKIGANDNGARTARQLPILRHNGEGVHRKAKRDRLLEYMHALANRLRRVRVTCGDWSRVCGSAVTVNVDNGTGVTGMFLDPPYSDEAVRTADLYAHDSGDIAHAVREWAIEIGSDSRARVALCGYEGEHAMPKSWECVHWKTDGGYGSLGNKRGRENARRERIWFSPHCLAPSLFAADLEALEVECPTD
jgi:hypothetical protein